MSEIEEIKSKMNIVDFVGEYVRLTRSGSGYKGLCPFHNEKTPSFTISEERQSFHCFGCQKGGDVFTFLMEMEGLDFKDALDTLAERTGTVLKKREHFHSFVESEKTSDPKRIYALLDLATAFYEKQLHDGQGKFQARGYLSERGMSEETLKKFRIGFAPAGWNNIETFLLSRGFSVEEMEQSGLLVQKEDGSMGGKRRYDRFRERIMFPVMDPLGRVVGYSARVLPGFDEQGAKYINTPETGVYHKSKVIYGLFQAKEVIKKKKRVIVVEGNMDVLAMHKSGFEHTVAVSGTALTADHLRILRRYAKEIVFFFDMDMAGQEAARKSVEMAHHLDIPCSIIAISGGKDAAEMALEHPEELSTAIEQALPAMEYFFRKWASEESLEDAQGKRSFAQKALSLIVALQNEVEVSHWISRLSDRLGAQIDVLYAMLKRLKKEEKTYERKNEGKVSIKSDDFLSRNRRNILGEKMAGLLFFNKKLWERYAQEFQEDKEHLREMISGTLVYEVLLWGDDCSYTFDSFRSSVDTAIRELAEKSYHDMEIQILQTKVVSQADTQKEVDYILEEMKKEYFKEKFHELQGKLSRAEKSRNVEEIQRLKKDMAELAPSLYKK